MLSDESSSDSETGRFKGQTKKTEEGKGFVRKQDSFRSGRGRPSENDRFRRDFDRKRDDYHKHSRDQHRFSRHSPVRRRHSRDRSPRRRSNERNRHRDARATSKTRDHRSGSRDRQKRSISHKSPEPRSRQQKSPEPKPRSHRSPEVKVPSRRTPDPKTKPQKLAETGRNLKEEIKRTLEPSRRSPVKIDQKSPKQERKPSPKPERRSREKLSSSPDYRGKRSEIHRPIAAPSKPKSESPVVVELHSDSDKSEEVQLGSYYNMIPAVVKEKSEASSEIDSSDDERLRAKLLNLEKELQKTRKKKHKKKHKRKTSKSSKERDVDTPVLVEVSSTTDIQDKVKDDFSQNQAEAVPEVTSTQKSSKKESSEEGELSSDDDSQINYDPSDLRHKLRRSKTDSSKPDVCGPALPPHLDTRPLRSSSPGTEGPALPPHLQSKPKSRNLGPSIPEDMRKVLADREVIRYESSDDDGIGPLPVGAEEKWSSAHQRLEERALDIKIKSIDGRSLDSQKVKSREEWMLALPEGKAKYLGLEARSFRAKAGPDMSDRSSWTDTPEEKAQKAAGIVKEEDADVVMRREARARLIASRDDEQEMAVKKHKKKHKREESLLEQHEKKLKKKKKKEEKITDGKKERRPFTRDIDLQVNRFDEAQKKSIIKKAQDLNSRFGSGEAKFL